MMTYTKCSDELIRIPGNIQNFGYLQGLDQDLKIISYSENFPSLFSLDNLKLGTSIKNQSEVFLKLCEVDMFHQLANNIHKFYKRLGIFELNGEISFNDNIGGEGTVFNLSFKKEKECYPVI